LKVDKEN